MNSVKLKAEHFVNKSLMIATPCYGGELCAEYTLSIYKLSSLLSAFEIKHTLNLMANESLVTRARNHLVAQFIASDYTHMMFIDADTDFNEQDILKFLYCDEEILCGAVPQKTLPTVYNSYLETTPDGNIKKSKKHGFIELDTIGTAFMMIKREVFEKMFKAYPNLKYKPPKEYAIRMSNSKEQKEKLNNSCYALFDTSLSYHKAHLDGKDEGYWGEDFTFVKRWQKIGGKILLDPSIKLNHIGRYSFQGDISKIL